MLIYSKQQNSGDKFDIEAIKQFAEDQMRFLKDALNASYEQGTL
jgi:hypothetical protein